MEIVEDRYGTGSTLITSQLPLNTWHEVVGDPIFADAILDRLVHNAYRRELEGQSFRKKTAKTDDEPTQKLIPETSNLKTDRRRWPDVVGQAQTCRSAATSAAIRTWRNKVCQGNSYVADCR